MDLKECYKEMDGDYDDVMTRLPREASVIKFLRRFAENGEFDELKIAAKDKDYKRVFELSHDLKGMAANLSISAFQKTISDICEDTRNKEPGDGFDVLLSKADEQHTKVVEAISKLED